MVSTFDHLCLLFERYSFDVITMSETWLKENNLLLQYLTIPGYVHAFNNRDRIRGGRCWCLDQRIDKIQKERRPRETLSYNGAPLDRDSWTQSP